MWVDTRPPASAPAGKLHDARPALDFGIGHGEQEAQRGDLGLQRPDTVFQRIVDLPRRRTGPQPRDAGPRPAGRRGAEAPSGSTATACRHQPVMRPGGWAAMIHPRRGTAPVQMTKPAAPLAKGISTPGRKTSPQRSVLRRRSTGGRRKARRRLASVTERAVTAPRLTPTARSVATALIPPAPVAGCPPRGGWRGAVAARPPGSRPRRRGAAGRG